MDLLFDAREKIGYVRSKTLAIFVILDIDKNDSCDLLHCLEKIDEHFVQTVSIKAFSIKYCINWLYAFNNLWCQYLLALDPDRTAEDEDYLTPNYLDFISFILLIMSLDDHSISKFVYFLYYYSPKVKANKENIAECIASVWGKGSYQFRSLARYQRKMTKVLQKEDGLEKMSYKRFRAFDWRSGGAFTVPLISIQKQLKVTMIGSSLWSRVIPLFTDFLTNPKDGLRRMADEKKRKKLPLPDAAGAIVNVMKGLKKYKDLPKPDFALLGERKQARKELKLFLALLFKFTELPVDDEDTIVSAATFGEKLSSSLSKVRSAIKRVTTGRSDTQIAPSEQEVVVERFRQKALMSASSKSAASMVKEDDDGDRVIVDETIEELRGRANVACVTTTDLIAKCREDLPPTPRNMLFSSKQSSPRVEESSLKQKKIQPQAETSRGSVASWHNSDKSLYDESSFRRNR